MGRQRVTRSELRDLKKRLEKMEADVEELEMQRRRVFADLILRDGLPLTGNNKSLELTRKIRSLNRSCYALGSRIHDIERAPDFVTEDDAKGQTYMFGEGAESK